jgi:dihydropteroate synthase
MGFSSVEDTHFPINRHLRLKDKLFDLSTPKVMGIVNLTPDSFYQSSRISADKELLKHVESMLNDGMDILDLGGYSSRPGAKNVSIQDEIDRVKIPIQQIKNAFPSLPLSLDTFRSEVAEVGINEGVEIINDISAGLLDERILDVVAAAKVPFIAMHMQGNMETVHNTFEYGELFNEMVRYFSERISTLQSKGIHDIILDPGFGFSKSIEQNYQLLNQLDQFQLLEKPILVGFSRKSMIYKKLNKTAEESLNGTTVLNTIALSKGASILRVHDVKEAKEIISLLF